MFHSVWDQVDFAILAVVLERFAHIIGLDLRRRAITLERSSSGRLPSSRAPGAVPATL